MEIALGSTVETRFLLRTAFRLKHLPTRQLEERYDELAKMLAALIISLEDA